MQSQRVDLWLWTARFFKTRSLAADAVKGGRVHVNGRRAKPSKDVRVGDSLEIAVGQMRFSVTTRGLTPRRGPASEAALLYEETAESRERREQLAAQNRLSRPPVFEQGGRPTKRDRRRLDEARRRGR